MKTNYFLMVGALLLAILTGSGLAQVNSSIGGTVQDATGALIPGVEVTATGVETGVVSRAISNESGVYNFPSLLPGGYTLSAELPGFRTATYNDVQLRPGAPIRLNFTRININEVWHPITADIVATLQKFGTTQDNINVLASVAVANGDFLRVSLTTANTGPGGGDNAGAGFPNGRRLRDDTIDIILTIVANNPIHLAGAITSDGADKAARFMQLCDAFGLPIVSLIDTVLEAREALPRLPARSFGAESAYLKIRYTPLDDSGAEALLRDLLAKDIRDIGDVAFAEQFHAHAGALLDEARGDERVRIDDGVRGEARERLQIHDRARILAAAVGREEPPLRQPAIERHLTALESAALAAARARLVPLVALRRRLAVAGPGAASDLLAAMRGAGCGPEVFKLHASPGARAAPSRSSRG